MVCIYCRTELAVSNSRPQKSRNQTWRRRPCRSCGAVFTSIESLDLSKAIVVAYERPGATTTTLEPFERDRLFISMYESLRHRPSAASDARGLCDTAIVQIIKLSEQGRVNHRTIISVVQDIFQRFDQAAASHYSAFHPVAQI